MKCEHCGREGETESWGGTYDGLSLARNPSLIKEWCRKCVLIAQIEYMRPMVAKLKRAEDDLFFMLLAEHKAATEQSGDDRRER